MSSVNDLPASERGEAAFALLLRRAIDPNWDYPAQRDPPWGALEAFSKRIDGKLSSSQIGRYARGLHAPQQVRTLEVLAAGMRLSFEQVRAVLDGKTSPTTLALPADDVLRLTRVLDQLAPQIEEARAMARRLSLLHTQSARQNDPRRRKKGDFEHPRLILNHDVLFQPA